jgi:hypothetical protein
MGYNTSAMLFDTLEEYDAEIAIVRESIRRQMLIGSGHMNNSGGSSRSTTETEIAELKAYTRELRKERGYLDPNQCVADADVLNLEVDW